MGKYGSEKTRGLSYFTQWLRKSWFFLMLRFWKEYLWNFIWHETNKMHWPVIDSSISIIWILLFLSLNNQNESRCHIHQDVCYIPGGLANLIYKFRYLPYLYPVSHLWFLCKQNIVKKCHSTNTTSKNIFLWQNGLKAFFACDNMHAQFITFG